MVFQSYALYPHMTVRENIEFGLKLHHLGDEEVHRRLASASELLGLDELLDRRPKALSGGQRQRVAKGRAIVREPKVFLMDEPLSNLDAKLRVHMRSEVLRLQRRLKTTMLYVTHDQVEAMTMGTRVAVMRDGALLQVGTPKEIYNRPLNAFIAGFIGSPSMNLAEATLDRDSNGCTWLHLGDQQLLLDQSVLAAHPALEAAIGKGAKVVFGVRPEDVEDAVLVSAPPERCLESTIELVEELGSQTLVHFAVNAVAVNAEERPDLAVAGQSGMTFVGTFNPRTQVLAGERARIAVDTMRLHFFDLATGASI